MKMSGCCFCHCCSTLVKTTSGQLLAAGQPELEDHYLTGSQQESINIRWGRERDEESHSHSTAEKCKMCKVCVCASQECLLPKGQKSSFTAEQKKAAKRWSKAAPNHSQQQHKKLEKGNAEVCVCVCDWPRSVAHSMITAASAAAPAKTQLKSAISSGLGIDLREPVRKEKSNRNRLNVNHELPISVYGWKQAGSNGRRKGRTQSKASSAFSAGQDTKRPAVLLLCPFIRLLSVCLLSCEQRQQQQQQWKVAFRETNRQKDGNVLI